MACIGVSSEAIRIRDQHLLVVNKVIAEVLMEEMAGV
jgi:hypothetical protein